MNKRQIVASLNSIANELDTKGLFKEANEVTEVMVRISQLPGMNETRPGHPSLPNTPPISNEPKETPKPDSDSLGPKIRMPYDAIPGLSSKPKNADGLDRWVNKAENIYKAWGQKGKNPNSSAVFLVKDIVDYMVKVKSNLPRSLHGAADVKIAKVKKLLGDIFDGLYNEELVPAPVPYKDISGYPGKGVDPFQTGPRLTEKQLNYQARNEGKSY